MFKSCFFFPLLLPIWLISQGRPGDATLVMLPVLLIFLVLQGRVTSGVAAGAVKG